VKQTWTPLNSDGPHGVATAWSHPSGARVEKRRTGRGGAWYFVHGTDDWRLPKKATFAAADRLLVWLKLVETA
jgi:hypothetical protein